MKPLEHEIAVEDLARTGIIESIKVKSKKEWWRPYPENEHPLQAIALSVNPSSVTAIANDDGFGHVFSTQLEALAKHGDIAFGISTNGCSADLIGALKSPTRKVY